MEAEQSGTREEKDSLTGHASRDAVTAEFLQVEGQSAGRRSWNLRFKSPVLFAAVLVCGVVVLGLHRAVPLLRGSRNTVTFTDLANRDLSGVPLWEAASQQEAASNHSFCNPNMPVPASNTTLRAFSLPEKWRDFCMNRIPHPQNAPVFAKRNWCWAWMKYGGCYDVQRIHGHWSWPKAQQKAADMGYAPDPLILPLQGLLHSEVCEKPSLGKAETDPSPADMADALAWFRRTFSVYVLSLPQAVERWHKISQQLKDLGIDGQRVFGVDLTKPGAFIKAQEEGLVPKSFDFQEAQYIASSSMGGIVGTVGTAAAHFRALATAARNAKNRPLAMIMEDDVQLAPDFVFRVKKLLAEEAPCDWSAISLKSRCPYGECVSPHLTRVRPDGNEPEHRCYHGVNYGFYTMIYRTTLLPDIWKMLSKRVWQTDQPRCLDIDVSLASLSEQVPYYAVPAVQQPGFLREGHMGSARWNANFQTLPPSTGANENIG